PQHFREHPQFAQDTLLDIAAAAPTTLLFLLPDDIDELVIGDGGLLGLCERLDVSVGSTIAVPARATLAPLNAHWRMGGDPELLSGRGSLWRAKLDAPVREGTLRARLKLTDIADAEFPVWDVIPSVADLQQRRGGVMEASRFDFSPIGASVRMHGPVDFHNDEITPDLQVLLDSYQHDIDFGRDSRVQVVSEGHLSSGHPASLIRLRRRIFVGGSPDIGFAQDESVAFLETINTVVVRNPVLAVDQLVAAYGGPARDMPFRTLRLLTTYASGIDDPPINANGGPFWVEAGREPLPFALQGIDWAGNVIDFSLPLVFIPGERRFDDAFSQTFNRFGVARHTAGTGSVSIALVAPETPAAAGVAPLTVDSIVLGVQRPMAGAGGPPVLPVLSSMRVVVDAATHFAGVKSSVEAVWHDAYRSSGLDAAANKLGSYLSLPNPLPIKFGDPRHIGGLAKPDMQVAALSVLKGAVPAGFDGAVPNADLIKRQFSAAKVLGMISLTDIVDFGTLGAPELTEKITKEQAELSYVFAARIKGEGNNSVLQPDGESALTLTAHTVRRFADGATTATITGTLSNVAIKIAGIVTLKFRELKFSANPGSTPTIDPQGLSLSFAGDLAFLQKLSDALDELGLGGLIVRVGTDRITAGFKVTLPALAMGMFSLTNLSVSAQLTVPFNGDPVEFTFAVAERFKPFSVVVSLFTGGGFFALTMTSRGVDRVEAALEFGGSMQFDLVVASGGLSVMAGIYFRLDGDGVTLGGYVRASGQLTVLGIITISADFFMQISYQESTGKAIGEASLTLGIKVLFFSKSVTLRVERRFSALSGDPTFTDCYELEDWEAYCDAFG
ncbi:MAG TPA: hypothetical protein VEK80_01125, partial [Kribbellaceae bacterium]|nr:hypothetical protein [Kribbellaceae bacterium]